MTTVAGWLYLEYDIPFELFVPKEAMKTPLKQRGTKTVSIVLCLVLFVRVYLNRFLCKKNDRKNQNICTGLLKRRRKNITKIE